MTALAHLLFRRAALCAVLPCLFVACGKQDGGAAATDSSLVSAIGLAELALAARTVAGAYSRYWEPYLFISVIYLVITLTLSAHVRGR